MSPQNNQADRIQRFGRIAFVTCLVVALLLTFVPSPTTPSPNQAITAGPQRLVSLQRLSNVTPTKTPNVGTRPIESIRVGDRVLAYNPEISDAQRARWEEPDWDRWVQLTLQMPLPGGTTNSTEEPAILNIEILRPEQWLREQIRWVVEENSRTGVGQDARENSFSQSNTGVTLTSDKTTTQPSGSLAEKDKFIPLVPLSPLSVIYREIAWNSANLEAEGFDVVGLMVEMDLPEMGASGTALITDIGPCPLVQSGAGQAVTATFSHPPSHQVLNVCFEGDSEAIGVTDNHLFWSVDREEFLPIGKMKLGERVRTYHGQTKRIESKLPRPGPQLVYNIEVYGEHVYFVGEQGILAHNMYPKNLPPNRGLPIADGAFHLTDEAKIATRTMTRAEWKAYNQAQRVARNPQSWSTTRRNYWQNLAEQELASPSGRYSETNLARMLEGRAPRVRVEVTSRRTGVTSTRDVSIELHHKSLPQRLRTPTANEPWNLEPAYPWAHEAMDPFRHTGYDLQRIIRGANSF